jgi:hypothetical protein
MMIKKRTAMVASIIVIAFIALMGLLSYVWLNISNEQYAILYVVLLLNVGVASMNIGLSLRNLDNIT